MPDDFALFPESSLFQQAFAFSNGSSPQDVANLSAMDNHGRLG